jgi:LmbE family N-acetylglucosaminyl deacetylase
MSSRVRSFVFALLIALPARAQLTPVPVDQGGNGLGLALRRLGVTTRVLYVTAHPDDEHNGALVRLSRGLGLRTALLTLTRGEGGQNAIGPELGEALGVVRTEELLAVHRYDGVEQYFARAYEFGFSVDVEETLAKWGHDETLGDVVRVIRTFRPDVILTLPLDESTHQHHSTSARLAREAFRAAALPDQFPEQIQSGLRPWQATRIYQGGVGGSPSAAGASPVKFATSAFDSLLGMSAQQFGLLARSHHRSQTARQMREDPGTGEATFLLVDEEPKAEAPAAGILDGLDPTLASLVRFTRKEEAQAGFLSSALARVLDPLAEARRTYDARAPEKTIAPLARALGAVRKVWDEVAQSRLSEAAREELLSRLDDQERFVSEALALAQGVAIEARLAEGAVVPGQTVGVTLSLWNQGQDQVTVDDASLEAPAGWSVSKKEGEVRALDSGQSLRLRYDLAVAAAARPSEPYWKRDPQKERYVLDSPAAETLPWSRPDVTASARVRVAGMALRLDAPATYRYEAPTGGEKQHVLEVVPALSLRLSPDLLLFPEGPSRAAKEVRVTVKNYAPGAGSATVRVVAPAGWKAEPKDALVRFERRGDEATARFFVTAPSGLGAANATLRAEAVQEGHVYGAFVQEIAYPHIQSRQRLVAAEARLLALDVRTAPGVRVGYVTGAGDLVPPAIEALGLPLTLLSADDLAFSDLGRFTTIVIGVRAYETRPDLRANHPRLLKWVEGGGHLLVQYHRAAFNSSHLPNSPPSPAVADSPYAPWPASVSSRRLTDETTKLDALVPASLVLTTPNRLGEADWAGWVQERAIQLLDVRDPRYVELLAGADPFPKNPGVQKGILVETTIGKGTWTYTGLVLFRQLPAGNPGAYRLLANLLSRPRPR